MQRSYIKTFALARIFGVSVDDNLLENYENQLRNEIDEIVEDIKNDENVKEFEKLYGKYNPSSQPQTVKLFENIIKTDKIYVEDKKNKKTKKTVDNEVLQNIDNNLAKLLVKYREKTKLKSTYIDPFIKENSNNFRSWKDSFVRPQYHLTRVKTGRLSSSDPNIQNQPKRKGEWVRDIYCAPYSDTYLMKADYGQLEARIIAALSGDKTMCQAMREDYDIHQEWAERIAHDVPSLVGGKKFIKDKQALKEFRGLVKNQWVFPSFYGADLMSVAGYLGVDPNSIKHLYEEFWKVFAGVKEWQDTILDDFTKYGYIENPNGRRLYHKKSDNALINYPVQSGASDIVVTAMRKATDDIIGDIDFDRESTFIPVQGMDAFRRLLMGIPIINVHDEIVSAFRKNELEEHAAKYLEYMLTVDEEFDWITVPLTVEIGYGDNWGTGSWELGTFKSDELEF